MSEGSALQASYVLHYTPWRDTSFIVDLFTLGHGRLGLVARGARAARPRTRALYQPFRPLLVSWLGEGELLTLTGIEESGAPLLLDGAALGSAYYVNELVLRLLGKGQPQPELFAHYALALARLATDGTDGAALQGTLRTFELQLLEALGVLPDLGRCTPDGTPVTATRRYRFHAANALAVPLGAAADDDVGAAEALHPDGMTPDEGVEVQGRTLLDMAALDFDDERTREEARALMRRLVAVQLGGRPLRSRSMFEALRPPPAPGEPSSIPPDGDVPGGGGARDEVPCTDGGEAVGGDESR